jgi:RNA polymerase sigma factor (sigma-70 family)
MSVTAPGRGRRGGAGGAGAIAGELCSERYRQLLSLARRHSPTREDAEDALQEALRLFISRFDPQGPSPAIGWLTLTLKRECWQRHQQRRLLMALEHQPCEDPEHTGPPADALVCDRPSPEERAERSEEVRGARERLAALKPAERRAIGLQALGYSYAEICRITGWSYTKVNRCLAEGKAALREMRTAG